MIKTYLRENLAFQSIPVIKNIFHITVVFNTGAAFGILRGKTNLLIYIGIVFILVFLIIVQKEEKKDLFAFVAYGLIFGGALSNMWDRIFLGYVVDYLEFKISPAVNIPVFNIADSCITIGAGLLAWQSFRKTKKINEDTKNHNNSR